MTYNWNIAQCSVLLHWWHGEHHEPGVYSTSTRAHTHILVIQWFNWNLTVRWTRCIMKLTRAKNMVCSDIDPDMPAHTLFTHLFNSLSSPITHVHTCVSFINVSGYTLRCKHQQSLNFLLVAVCWMCLGSSTNDEVTDTNNIKTSAGKLWRGQLNTTDHSMLRHCSFLYLRRF